MKKINLLWRTLSSGLLLGAILLLLPQCANNAGSESSSEDSDDQEMAEAQDLVQKASDPIERGKELYISYCQICHGKNGELGPMGEDMKVQPPDMRKIAALNGGEFPEERVFKVIKGEEKVTGHNQANMPLWGETFRKSEGLESDAEAEQEIRHIVSYLKTIQG
jgi:mono/diheme cytochrome c family protein